MLDKLREALKPGDLRRREEEQQQGPKGVLLQSHATEGHQGLGYAEENRGMFAVENPSDPGSKGILDAVTAGGASRQGSGGGGIVNTIKEVFQGSSSEPEFKRTGAGEREPKNYAYESYPGTEGSGGEGRAFARVSPLDSQGSIGNEFSVNTLESLS